MNLDVDVVLENVWFCSLLRKWFRPLFRFPRLMKRPPVRLFVSCVKVLFVWLWVAVLVVGVVSGVDVMVGELVDSLDVPWVSYYFDSPSWCDCDSGVSDFTDDSGRFLESVWVEYSDSISNS